MVGTASCTYGESEAQRRDCGEDLRAGFFQAANDAFAVGGCSQLPFPRNVRVATGDTTRRLSEATACTTHAKGLTSAYNIVVVCSGSHEKKFNLGEVSSR